ncbi:MAG: hypothetical protein PHQ75_14475 [Thermoguttaceae bacterium]|nr:hypothetical protein [Thermoguttaceae bacterium]
MTIKVVCPNGHKLAAKESRAGTFGKCPACGATVKIPSLEQPAISESSILRLLDIGEDAKPEEPAAPAVPVRSQEDQVLDKMFSKNSGSRATQICPQCDWEIDAAYRICPHCRYYLIGKVGEF